MKHLTELDTRLPSEEEIVPFTMRRLERQIENAINMNLTEIEAGLNPDEKRFVKSIRKILKEAGFKSRLLDNSLVIYWKVTK